MKIKALVLSAAAAVFSAGYASAATVDLTAAGSSATVNGAVFEQTVVQPSGTGVIRSFVRVQSPGSDTTEEGYNTDGRPLPFDENNSPEFTRSIQLDTIIVENIGGTDYRRFMLDINEPGNITSTNGLISLDQVKIYLGDTGDKTTTNLADLGTLVYDLDAGEDNTLKLRDRNSGSGQADYFMFIPNSLFLAASNGNNPYVYLFSHFGDLKAAGGGFEEWAAITGETPVIPLPPAAWVGLMTMAGTAAGMGRKRIKAMMA